MLKKKIFQTCVELTNGKYSSTVLKKLTKSNLSRLLIQPFAKVYNIDTTEMLEEIDDFKNLNEFFTRKLHPDARPINNEVGSVVSPVDGKISEVGNLTSESTFVVKGQEYNVRTLLGDGNLAEEYADGIYMIVYLSPRNYHRIHIPLDSKIEDAYSLGKYSYPVNNLGLELGDKILSYNYRQVYNLSADSFSYLLVAVGAQNVNSIVPTYDSIYLKKGDELGYFEFGSTVVLLFKKDQIKLEEIHNKEIKMGEKIAEII